MKKMIKNIFILPSLLLSLLLASCADNLEPYIYGSINNEDAFKTVADVDANITSIYHHLRRNGWGGYMFSNGSNFVMDVACTDEWTTRWDWDSFLRGAWFDNEDVSVGFYREMIPAITHSTHVLANIENSELEESIKNRSIAEVKALRAIMMFDIFRLYGPVPMITDPEIASNPSSDYKPTRPTAEDVLDEIETDLLATIEDLPLRWPVTGRITKGAAMHYLLKMYMHQKQWQKALNIANDIINLNVYSLEPNYSDIFTEKGNDEAIFVIPAGYEDGYGNHTFANIIPGDFKGPGGTQLVGWNGHRMPWAFYDSFDDNDRRKDLILDRYTNVNNQVVILRNQTGNNGLGALPLKYGIDENSVGIWAGNEKVLDRYAEVLLFKAEALNELNGPNQESVDLLNQIRRRGFGFGIDVIPGRILLEESFDNDINGERAGIFLLKNYQEALASWTYRIEDSEALQTERALVIDIASSGNQLWALQVRNETFPAEAGRSYKITFKAMSTIDLTFDFRFERAIVFNTEPVTLTANEPKDVTIITSERAGAGEANMFIRLGNSGSDYQLWIDDFVVETMPKQNTGGGDSYKRELIEFADKESFREAILEERGWEFWYEGKRREDLIRMGKYIEVGQASGATDFGEKNLLFPIPVEYINDNHNLRQNPGY